MPRLLAAALLACALPVGAAKLRWDRVDVNMHALYPSLAEADLSPAERAALFRLLFPHLAGDPCPTVKDEPFLRYLQAPLGRPGIVYVLPTGGCLRSAGANSGLWLVDLRRTPAVVLASPENSFLGWGLAIQKRRSHDLNDVVIPTHEGAYETDMIYFRYNGRIYRPVGSIQMRKCDRDSSTYTFCLPNGQPAWDSARVPGKP